MTAETITREVALQRLLKRIKQPAGRVYARAYATWLAQRPAVGGYYLDDVVTPSGARDREEELRRFRELQSIERRVAALFHLSIRLRRGRPRRPAPAAAAAGGSR